MKIDHIELLQNRLATQFQESPNLIAFITAFLRVANELDCVLDDIHRAFDLDTATGDQLDIIGRLVGQPRDFIPDIDPDTFTFDIGPGFDLGRFIINEGFIELTDEEYRRWIRARIARNTNQITPEDIIASVRFVFGDIEVFFTDGDTQYIVSIGQALTLADRYLIQSTDILPRTAAVNGMFGVSFTEESFSFDTAGLGFDLGRWPVTI